MRRDNESCRWRSRRSGRTLASCRLTIKGGFAGSASLRSKAPERTGKMVGGAPRPESGSSHRHKASWLYRADSHHRAPQCRAHFPQTRRASPVAESPAGIEGSLAGSDSGNRTASLAEDSINRVEVKVPHVLEEFGVTGSRTPRFHRVANIGATGLELGSGLLSSGTCNANSQGDYKARARRLILN